MVTTTFMYFPGFFSISMMVSGASARVTVFVRSFSMSTFFVRISSIASSNSPALVRAPRMSISFRVIMSVGSGVSFFGQPVRVMRPAWLT